MLVVFPQVYPNCCALCYQNLVNIGLLVHIRSFHYVDDILLVGVMD